MGTRPAWHDTWSIVDDTADPGFFPQTAQVQCLSRLHATGRDRTLSVRNFFVRGSLGHRRNLEAEILSALAIQANMDGDGLRQYNHRLRPNYGRQAESGCGREHRRLGNGTSFPDHFDAGHAG